MISGSAEGAQDISSAAMWGHLAAMAEIVAQDPDVADVGYTAGSSAFNTGNFYINLKPRAQRTASADQIIARLRPKLATVEGANLYLQVPQDIKVGGRLGRTQYQYTLQDADLDELDVWAPKLVAKLQGLKQLADVTSDQQANAATATLTIDRDRAARFGIQPTLIDATIYDAIGQREVTQYFTQLNAYHVVLEVDPALQTDPRLFDKLYLTSPHHRSAGAGVDLHAPRHDEDGVSRHQSSEPVSIGDGELQPGGRGGARRCGDGGSAGREPSSVFPRR